MNYKCYNNQLEYDQFLISFFLKITNYISFIHDITNTSVYYLKNHYNFGYFKMYLLEVKFQQ